ncbi:uncharacterized protein LOC120648192 isoform X2 [Panicum virgatum]|uniref:Ubiquitin-like domain-containing protein n=1 Tax=Panicum virgatum TaxID=38727 RepID=A0A8T0XAZ1_PANVG|nr:uncharacterized protein LOC120648192 isoform X2 [Panicum virgatum]KAG2656575.1 hypothetical protein PVAP13_1KG094100 [Panicum virgatum]
MPASSIRSASPDSAGDVGGALALMDLAVGVGGGGALSCGRSSFSYRRIPDPPLRLTVRKLDGSFFDVEIARSAAVWELKAAIEELFFTLFDDTDKAISWQHVWSHFCLCFKDEKLTDDKATLRAFGIRDGDKLHFTQHLSVDDSPCKSLSKNQKAASHRRSTTSLDDSRPRNLLDDLNEDEGVKFTYSRCSTSVFEDLCIHEYNEERVEEERPKKGSLFRGWFSYSKLMRGNRRTHAEYTVPLSCEKKNTRPKFGKWFSSKR